MDLKGLQPFVAVAELGTVSRAALDVRISQLLFRDRSAISSRSSASSFLIGLGAALS